MNQDEPWVFRNKLKTALALGPVLGTTISYATPIVMGSEPIAIEDLNIQSQIIVPSILGGMLTHISLDLLSKMKPPRVRNLGLALGYSFGGRLQRILGMKEKAYRSRQNLMGVMKQSNPNIELAVEAAREVEEGNFGHALDLYSEYLEKNRKRKRGPYDPVIMPGVRKIIQYNPNPILRRLEEAFLHLEWGDEKESAKSMFGLLRENPYNFELRLLNALFLSKISHPDEVHAWEGIICDREADLKSVGDSRNEVFEIDDADEYVKQVVIIKRGPKSEFTNASSNLEYEHSVLETLEEEIEPEKKMCVTPIVCYKEEDSVILVTKRKKGQNLESLLGQSPERKLKESLQAMTSLARIHGVDKDKFKQLKPYNIHKALSRRFIERFGVNKHTREFFNAYIAFARKFSLEDETFVHGDFYPTNVIEGGIILDFETGCVGEPGLDYENFIAAPSLVDIDKDLLFKRYKEEREESEKRIIHISNRELYAVHTAICQTGSFYAKGDMRSSQHFFELAVNNLKAMNEAKLEEHLVRYLSSANSSTALM